ncbi:hypothetical protein MGMO_73c00130 [Methyloglobulus morosus KoM1]|uniref:Uncharacterized protein n=1 Tax=Methyloglobulus morosus KoM1 TaxID=1116472 RepID=V5BW63_9GAMM|nr:hypothetical protein MGMO_73c00130 [Methyloglobulus morosus KoM1]
MTILMRLMTTTFRFNGHLSIYPPNQYPIHKEKTARFLQGRFLLVALGYT